MANETTKPKAHYAKKFRPIQNFKDWLERWNAAVTVEEAIGLLHALPNHFWQDEKPVGVRFLLEYVDFLMEQRHQETILAKARDTLFFRVFKEGASYHQGDQLLWFQAFCQDPDLLPLALKVVNHYAGGEEQTKIKERFVEKCFAVHYGHIDNWPGPVQAVVRQNLMPLLELSQATHVRPDDSSDEMPVALRTLAFRPDRTGKPPRDLDEAMVNGNGLYAHPLLLIETTRRARERRRREQEVEYIRNHLKSRGEELARMLAEPDRHAPAAIKKLQAEIAELNEDLSKLAIPPASAA